MANSILYRRPEEPRNCVICGRPIEDAREFVLTMGERFFVLGANCHEKCRDEEMARRRREPKPKDDQQEQPDWYDR